MLTSFFNFRHLRILRYPEHSMQIERTLNSKNKGFSSMEIKFIVFISCLHHFTSVYNSSNLRCLAEPSKSPIL